MKKLYIVPKNVQLNEKEIDQLWLVLEILDKLCITYLENGDVKNQQAVMKESSEK